MNPGCPVPHGGFFPFSRADQLDMPPEYSELQESAPISLVTLPSGDTAWLVTRYADVKAVLAHPSMSRDLNRPGAARMTTKIGSGNYGNPFADQPEHRRWRGKVARAFTPRQVARIRPEVEDIVGDLVDGLRDSDRPVDLMASFAYPLPIRVLCHMLGIPVADHTRFRRWVDTILSEEHGSDDRTRASLEIRDYAMDLADAKRADPGEDFLSGLVTDQKDPLDDDEIFVTVMTLLVAGYKTTAAELAKGLLLLDRAPEQFGRLRVDPDLAPRAVQELLRYTPPGNGMGLARYATRDVRIGDVQVPAGATVLCARHAANRDERQFRQGGELDLSRLDAHQHLTFGAGRAYCFGAPVAEMELEIALRELLLAFPDLAVVDEVEWVETMATQVPRKVLVSWS